MSYSNGKLPEDTFSHEKVIEIVKGLPGVGFKLTDAGDYDIQNKKLRNVASPETNNDVTTKSYVDNKALLVDGSNKMLGALNMDNRRVENIAPARHGQSDAVSSLHLNNFYFDLNTNDGKIEAQNPIDMKNEKISNLAEGTDNSDAITKHQLETGLAPKADKTELSNYLKKDGSIALTNNLDLGDNKIVNVKEATSGTDAVNFTQLNNELYRYLHESGGDMTGDIRMNNNSIYGIGNVGNDTSAVNRKYVNDELGKKPNTDTVVLRDGSQTMTGNLDMNNQRIINVANPISETDVVNRRYFETHVNNIDLSDYLKRDGTVSMTGNLDMSLNKIINCGQPTGARDVTNKAYVDSEVGKTLKLDGSGVMTSVLDMNNQRIINLGNATHNQDAITLKQVNDGIATVSTENNEYTDQQIAKSHISTHTNRKNVLSYAMDDGEFTEDFGIQDVNLIDFDDMPHKMNKKAFSMKVRRTTDGSNEYKGRFDFNLFKMYRDNKSDKYTVCVETYFQKSPFYGYEFESTLLGFEKLNMNIDLGTTIKVNSEYKYLRTILNLSPDGTSPSIQRRLYVNFKSNFDNNSPNLLPVFVLIYGIKGEAKSDLDMTIYDYEKAYEVANNKFQLHVPVDMNNHKITGLGVATDDNDAISKKFFNDNIYLSIDLRTPNQSGYAWELRDAGNKKLQFSSIYIKTVNIAQRFFLMSGRYRISVTHGTPAITTDFYFSINDWIVYHININKRFLNVTTIEVRVEPGMVSGVSVYFTGTIIYAP